MTFDEKPMKDLRLIVAICFMASIALALPIHHYPGLDRLIEQSTDIAIISVNERIMGNGTTYDSFMVTVLHTIKGGPHDEAPHAMALAHLPIGDTSEQPHVQFVEGTKYLVFLETNNYESTVGGSRRNLPVAGSCMRLGSDIPWEYDPSLSPHQQLHALYDVMGWKK